MMRTPDIILSVEVGSLGIGSENIPTRFPTEELFTMGGIQYKIVPSIVNVRWATGRSKSTQFR